jgi:hypothetical protein
MFTRSKGRFMSGKTNYNVREDRDHDGQVVVEKQSRSLWGTQYGEWERETNKGNHKKAREHANERRER